MQNQQAGFWMFSPGLLMCVVLNLNSQHSDPTSTVTIAIFASASLGKCWYF